MSRRLIVTGASGFVVGNVIGQAGEEWEVHAISMSPAPIQRENLHWHNEFSLWELFDPSNLRWLFDQIRPDAVIHAAAIADIDYCEKYPDVAKEVNVEYTRAMADMCRERRVRMVLASTDTVFDGVKGNYTETDPVGPVNHYGQTKARAEAVVAERVEDWAIARLAIVMGLPFFEGGNSFLARLITALESKPRIPVIVEEIRTPVDVISLARALLELAGNSFQGSVHLGGNDRLDRLVFSRLIAERLGFPPEGIVPAKPGEMVGRAPRPMDVSLDSSKARTVLKTPLLGLMDGLELVLANRRN